MMSFSWKQDWWWVVGAGAAAVALVMDLAGKKAPAKSDAPTGVPDSSVPPPVAKNLRSYRPAPDGYWYIVAYEQTGSAPSTWGSGNTPVWKSYGYYDGKPHAGSDAYGISLGAQAAHTKPLTPGAVRAWWWNGVGWEHWPELARNW